MELVCVNEDNPSEEAMEILSQNELGDFDIEPFIVVVPKESISGYKSDGEWKLSADVYIAIKNNVYVGDLYGTKEGADPGDDTLVCEPSDIMLENFTEENIPEDCREQFLDDLSNALDEMNSDWDFDDCFGEINDDIDSSFGDIEEIEVLDYYANPSYKN